MSEELKVKELVGLDIEDRLALLFDAVCDARIENDEEETYILNCIEDLMVLHKGICGLCG